MKWWIWVLVGAGLMIGVQALARIPRQDNQDAGSGYSGESRRLSDILGYE